MSSGTAPPEVRAPDWVRLELCSRPGDVTLRGAAADWLDDHDLEPALAGAWRWMCREGKYPAARKLSPSPDNLALGWGWFQHSLRQPHAVVPPHLWPPKRHPLAKREWAWATPWEAEVWFLQLLMLKEVTT